MTTHFPTLSSGFSAYFNKKSPIKNGGVGNIQLICGLYYFYPVRRDAIFASSLHHFRLGPLYLRIAGSDRLEAHRFLSQSFKSGNLTAC